MPLGRILWVLAAQCAAYMALAVYLDAALPDENGVRRPPWFLLQPSFWWSRQVLCSRAAQRALETKPEWEEGLLVDHDVQQESQKMRDRCRRYVGGLRRPDSTNTGTPQGAAASALSLKKGAATAAGGGIDTPLEGVLDLLKSAGAAGSTAADSMGAVRLMAECCALGAPAALHASPAAVGEQRPAKPSDDDVAGSAPEPQQAQHDSRPYAVEMYGLRRVYRRSGLLRRRAPFEAVRGTWLGIHEGECFCLVGPNGAGKSTTIHCLTGVLPLSAGDAVVNGQSIATPAGMDAVRPAMGVCPQFDVLWDCLTGREHLHLFAAIKGLPPADTPREVAALLEDVRLSEAGGVRAGAYSGGMRRRLSVAIAMLGDPKVVYLDEPTTGLDPISRRHLWDLIDRAKRGRAIVLTTHSMEEADILGDRIGIMARGRLRCIGTSLRLKSRFGSGYKISVRVKGRDCSPNPLSRAAPHLDPSLAPQQTIPAVHDAHATPIPAQRATTLTRLSNAHQGEGRQGEGAAVREGVSLLGGGLQHTDSVMAVQMSRMAAVFWDRLGVRPVDEAQGYLHFLVPYENEDKMSLLFTFLKAHSGDLGVADLQLRLTPLEEVFLNVWRKAELEHAQAEGHYEMLSLPEESISIKVPLGAELIQSPGGHLYHITWRQDEAGALKLHDFWRDPVSAAVLEGEEAGASLGGSNRRVAAAR